MLDYARIFGLKTAVFRHSSMYGGRQFATYDQGWVGWFCQKAVEASKGITQPFTISGNGKQVRDVLHAEDMISLYFKAMGSLNDIQGNAFNIGGSIKNSLSLLELFDLLQEQADVKLNYIKLPVRESDQKVFVADISKINKLIDWQPNVSAKKGVQKMFDWCNHN
ncbi:CDP-paratose 2-epimerase [compost metagenome]